MAKKKISGLPAGSALNGTELVPIVQTGTTKRITTQDIANLGNASGVEGSGTINKLAKFTASSTIGNSQLFDDGTSVGLGTITPLGLLHLFKASATTRMVMDGNAAQNRVISYRTNAVQRFGLYVNNTAESGANAGSDFAIRAYNDAGTLLSTPLFIKRSTGAATLAADATINGVNVGRGLGNDATNTSVGNGALATNTAGVQNTAIGRNALISNVIGTENTAVGWGCLFNNLADYNTAIGRSAMGANNSGFRNTAVGRSAMASNTSGNYNTAIGMFSLTSNTTASNNTAIGYASLDNNTASNNTAVGFEAATSNTSGNPITAVGFQALRANTTGSDNVALGYRALYNNTTGSINTAIGDNAMDLNTTGSSNVVVGVSAQTGNFDSSIIFGRNAGATASNQFVVGSAAYPSGAVATEVLVSDRSWAVKINGTDYKILMKA